jgi:hypothetical protein
MIEFVEGFSRKRLEVPSFADEYQTLERRYAQRILSDGSAQASLNFPAETSAPTNSFIENLTATSLVSNGEETSAVNESASLSVEGIRPLLAEGHAAGI